jgi:hypothetical protein
LQRPWLQSFRRSSSFPILYIGSDGFQIRSGEGGWPSATSQACIRHWPVAVCLYILPCFENSSGRYHELNTTYCLSGSSAPSRAHVRPTRSHTHARTHARTHASFCCQCNTKRLLCVRVLHQTQCCGSAPLPCRRGGCGRVMIPQSTTTVQRGASERWRAGSRRRRRDYRGPG